jgi:hypothetical protein
MTPGSSKNSLGGKAQGGTPLEGHPWSERGVGRPQFFPHACEVISWEGQARQLRTAYFCFSKSKAVLPPDSLFSKTA